MREPRDAHITFDDYLLVLQGELPLGALLRKVHAHVLAKCPVCRDEWEGDGSFPFAVVEVDEREDATSSEDVERSIERLSTSRKLYREARVDFERLMKVPRDEWVKKVEGARSRYRTRAFAQRLIYEAKERVREDPPLAHDLAALVPVSLRWATRKKRGWAKALVLLSTAHRANALRVSGELVKARRLFAGLSVERIPPGQEKIRSEIDSLDASLHIAEARYTDADRLLERVEAWHRSQENREEIAKVAIMRGNVAEIAGEIEQSFIEHSKAAGLLNERESPFLYFATVAGRVLALTELDRLQDAASLLDRRRSSYEEGGGKYGIALWKCHAGRLALKDGREGEAIPLLEAGRDALLGMGRRVDSSFASLDLATAYMTAGDVREVRNLVSGLVTVFEALGIEHKLLVSLRLLAEAEKIEASHLSLIAKLRRTLKVRSATL